MPVEDLMVVATSPYIRPLARLIEDFETFGLVIAQKRRDVAGAFPEVETGLNRAFSERSLGGDGKTIFER